MIFAAADLSRNFDAAARAFPGQMADITGAPQPDFLPITPYCRMAEWDVDAGIPGGWNNCTNLALHRNTCDRLQPGQVAAGRGLRVRPIRCDDSYSDFVADVCANVRLDGLVPFRLDPLRAVGASLPLVALFTRRARDGEISHDYHWLALRRDADTPDGTLFWVEKNDYDRTEDCDPYDGDIFAAAADSGYTHFAGYYGVPHHVMILKSGDLAIR